MGYNVNFDALDTFYYSTQSQCNNWSEQLKGLESAINALQGSSNMSGEAAENIKEYFQSVHITILGLLGQLIALHSYNCLLYKQDYNSTIDTDLHAVIKSNELSNIISQIKSQKQLALTVNDTVAYALSGIRDIFSIG